MLCENCQLRDASVHVKQSHNNQLTEYNLCTVCAQEMEQSGHSSFNEIFGGLFNSMFWGPSGFSYPKQRVQATESLKCPNCGLTERELLKGGFLGCPQCYEVFAKVLTPVFQRVQGHTAQAEADTTSETSAASTTSVTPDKNSDPISQLRQEQQAAVAAEDYEKAARLRDEIRNLEQAQSENSEHDSSESQSEKDADTDEGEQV
ncbi:MAG: UvrB/UvrC motif-containing protein [Eubacteriales bacterium]|nr:UvrB/UvrC motif-containing protein [Eubacteriales bacterium]MDD4541178.1 UvrB/UvrC motif-containing protein [Eubacteriales bacterium]